MGAAPPQRMFFSPGPLGRGVEALFLRRGFTMLADVITGRDWTGRTTPRAAGSSHGRRLETDFPQFLRSPLSPLSLLVETGVLPAYLRELFLEFALGSGDSRQRRNCVSPPEVFLLEQPRSRFF